MNTRTLAKAWPIAAAIALIFPAACAQPEKPLPGIAIAEMGCARCHEVNRRTIPGRHVGDGSPPTFLELAHDPRVTPKCFTSSCAFPMARWVIYS